MISFPSAASIILQLKYLNDKINEMIFDDYSIYKMNIKFKNNNVEIDCISKKDKNCKEIGENNYLNQIEDIKLKHGIKTKNVMDNDEIISDTL